MQMPPGSVRSHPTAMRILNYAGAAAYQAGDREAGLAAGQN